MAQKDKTKKDTYMLKTLMKMYERGEIRADHGNNLGHVIRSN